VTDHRPAIVPATVIELSSEGGCVQVGLRVDDGVEEGEEVSLSIAVADAAGRALPHIHALHGHSTGCRGRIDVHVDLLLRCCAALGSTGPTLVVRRGETPAFWLQLPSADGAAAHVDVGVLDALVLLASRRVPVVVESLPTDIDWDAALRSLQAD
jgi:hypothetical protein